MGDREIYQKKNFGTRLDSHACSLSLPSRIKEKITINSLLYYFFVKLDLLCLFADITIKKIYMHIFHPIFF